MQFVDKYLQQYKVPSGVRICDPTWKELLSEIVHRYTTRRVKNAMQLPSLAAPCCAWQ